MTTVLQVCRNTLLAEGGLQALLQHLHQLLLPVINAPASDSSQEQGSPGGAPKDCKQLLGVEEEDLDMLLAVLEALAAADTTPQVHQAQATTLHSGCIVLHAQLQVNQV